MARAGTTKKTAKKKPGKKASSSKKSSRKKTKREPKPKSEHGFPQNLAELDAWIAKLHGTCETVRAHAVVDCIEDCTRRLLFLQLSDPNEAANMHGKLRSHFRELAQAQKEHYMDVMIELRRRARDQEKKSQRLGLH